MSPRLKMAILLAVLGALAASWLAGAWPAPLGAAAEPATPSGLLVGLVLLLLAVWLGQELFLQRPLRLLQSAAQKIARTDCETDLPSVKEPATRQAIAAVLGLREELCRCRRELHHEADERRKAKQALHESEQRYALAVRGADDGLWEWSIKAGTVYYSPRWKSMLGYAEEEIGDSFEEWRSRVHPQDLPRALAELDAHLEGRSPRYEVELRMRHKDGGDRWILARGAAIRNAAGEAYRVVGLHTDITERKRAEEALWLIVEATSPVSGEPFFRALVRNFARSLEAPCAFVTECMDYPTTRMRTLAFWMDRGFWGNFDYELTGTPCEEVIHDGKVTYIPTGVSERYPKERELGMDSYLGVPIFDSAGSKVVGHLAFLDRRPLSRDLLTTPIFHIFAARASLELERLRVERDLLVERQRLQAALGPLRDGVVVTDALGEIAHMNPAAERLSGWSQEEARGRSVGTVLRLFHAPAGQPVLEASFDEFADQPRASPLVLVARDGAEQRVELALTPVLDPQGERSGQVAVLREVSAAAPATSAAAP